MLSDLGIEARCWAKSPRRRRSTVVLLSLGVVLLMTQAGKGQPSDALTFFKNYFVTGNYFVYGVPLKGTGANGFATGTITIPANSVPAGGQVIAAHLYWSTVTSTSSPQAGLTGSTFRGQPLSPVGKALNPSGTSPCWSSGGGTGNSQGSKILVLYHADVLSLFQKDSNGELLVDGGHEVKFPDSGGGNGTPFTLGASLIVVYRIPTDPLRSIVLYDGGFTMDNATDAVSQTIKGFYQASTNSPQASLSLIIGDGQPNFGEQVRFNGDLIAENEIGLAGGPWDSLTRDVSTLMVGDDSSATVTLGHDGPSYDCLTGGVMVFATTVQDTDSDGLLDKWESSTAGYPCPASTASNCDPLGQPLPDLASMKANPNRKDLFVEIGYMFGPTGLIYGSGPATTASHSHLPPLSVLERVGAAFNNTTAVSNPNGSTGIYLHFDVGNNYQAATPATQSPYIIRVSEGAKGGEFVTEKKCGTIGAPSCATTAFPDWPGTVGWKNGFEAIKNALVGQSGQELPGDETAEDQCESAGTCRRRFDRVRKDMFHYLFVAHSLGVPKSFDGGPLSSVPVTISGISDKPGGDFMMTLGSWGNNFQGPEFIQASTIAHELGHNLWRGHSGNPFFAFENNCNPQYLSVMNYMYQTKGLLDVNGVPQVDYSVPRKR